MSSRVLWALLLLGLLQVPLAVGQGTSRAIGVASQPAAPRVFTLIIGINGYRQAPLRYCVKDATSLAESLRTQCGLPPERIFLMTDGRKEFKDVPTADNIRENVRLLAGLPDENDALLVYFSGHGVTLDGKSYLVPIDGRPDDPERLLGLDELRQLLRESKAKWRLLILDACHSGGEKSGTPATMSKAFEDSLRQDSEGFVTIASCGAEEESLEAEWYGQGLFTYWLLQGLDGKADVLGAGNKDRHVELMELYKYVYEAVRQEAAQKRGHRQNPILIGRIEGSLYLAEVAPQTATPPAPVAPPVAQPVALPPPNPTPPPNRPPSPPVAAATPLGTEFPTRNLNVRLTAVRRSGPRVTLRFALTPSKDLRLALHGNVSRLYDDNGREYRCAATTLADKSSGSKLAQVRTNLTQGVTVQAEYTFDGVPADVVRLMRVHIELSDGEFDVRNVAIQ